MNGSQHRWLMGEIAAWQGEGLVSAEQADRLRARYPEPVSRNWALVVTSILGAALIGLGLILLLAYNWDQLGRGARAVLAYLPLLAALGLGGWMLASGRTTTGWREGVGIFLALAIGASLSLVAQTYQMGGTFRTLLLVWMILLLPAVYILDALMPALVYLAGVTGWALGQDAYNDPPYAYWLLLGGLVPAFWLFRRSTGSIRSAFFNWGIALSVPLGVMACMHSQSEAVWYLLYAALFGTYLLAGELLDDPEDSLWSRPLALLGKAGLGVLVFMCGFLDFWEDIDLTEPGSWWNPRYEGARMAGISLLGAFLVLYAVLFGMVFRRFKGLTVRMLALFPLVAAAMAALNQALEGMEMIPAILMNLFGFALGLAATAEGVREAKLGVMNAGLALVAALTLARFFDSDMSILWRGVAFIGLGAAFLVANIVLIRRRRAS